MSIVINQGKGQHNPDAAGGLEPIVEKNVTAEIIEVKKHDKFPNTISITFKVLSGDHKGRLFWDNVSYDPKSIFAWKYIAMRKSAGVPYSKDEPAQIDIEELLKNRAVTVDLSEREDKKDSTKKYQRVDYKIPKGKSKKKADVKAAPKEEEEGFDEGMGDTVEADENPAEAAEAFDGNETEDKEASPEPKDTTKEEPEPEEPTSPGPTKVADEEETEVDDDETIWE